MNVLVLTGAGISIEDVAGVARGGRKVEVAPAVIERLDKARKVLDQTAAAGQPIYGLNTGLGANLETSVGGDASAFQRQLLEGRSGAVGETLPQEIVRATMLARAAMLSVGGSGISLGVFAALVEALNAGVYPVMPSLGSIGAGDLVLMAALGRMLTGDGEADYQGRRMPSAKALMLARLTPISLAPKDGLSLINASHRQRRAGGRGRAVCLDATAAGRRADHGSHRRQPDDPRSAPARGSAGCLPAGRGEGVARIAGAKRAAGAGNPPGSAVDPLHALDPWRADPCDRSGADAVEIELNAAADNPLVMGDDELVLSTGNFHTASLALAFETLGLAIAQTAAACAARFIQLTGSGRNGLPKYLSPVGGASAGFVPLQKTVTAILATIRHKANPVMLDFLPVSEGVEDHATQTLLAISKCAEMIGLWRRLIALELMAAAQAVDLREGLALAPATGVIHAAVRVLVLPLKEDRPLGIDAETLYATLANGSWQA